MPAAVNHLGYSLFMLFEDTLFRIIQCQLSEGSNHDMIMCLNLKDKGQMEINELKNTTNSLT